MPGGVPGCPCSKPDLKEPQRRTDHVRTQDQKRLLKHSAYDLRPTFSDVIEERHTLAVVVDNEAGVLARVIGLFSGRGYNIESLTVAEVDHAGHTEPDHHRHNRHAVRSSSRSRRSWAGSYRCTRCMT
jgi:hypothetical protein